MTYRFIFFITLFTFIINNTSEEKVEKKETSAAAVPPPEIKHDIATKQKRLDDFLSKHKPTAMRCRPSRTEHGPNPDTLTHTIQGSLACILVGYKQVALFPIADLNKLSNNELILMKEHAIQYLTYGTGLREHVILYKISAAPQAYLLAKVLLATEDDAGGVYLTGLLLGYPQADIEAFYKNKIPHLFSLEELALNKKQALEWIEKNKTTIQDWITANARKFNIRIIEI